MGLESEGASKCPRANRSPVTRCPGYYYVQGVHKWQAPVDDGCVGGGTAAWGDNLIGHAKLTVGSPIRVELGLFDDHGRLDAWALPWSKLEPSKLDRRVEVRDPRSL